MLPCPLKWMRYGVVVKSIIHIWFEPSSCVTQSRNWTDLLSSATSPKTTTYTNPLFGRTVAWLGTDPNQATRDRPSKLPSKAWF